MQSRINKRVHQRKIDWDERINRIQNNRLMKVARNRSSINRRNIGWPRRDDATVPEDRKARDKKKRRNWRKFESLKKKNANHAKSIADESARDTTDYVFRKLCINSIRVFNCAMRQLMIAATRKYVIFKITLCGIMYVNIACNVKCTSCHSWRSMCYVVQSRRAAPYRTRFLPGDVVPFHSRCTYSRWYDSMQYRWTSWRNSHERWGNREK